jgi:plasmid maintenance system antidote protein VapI
MRYELGRCLLRTRLGEKRKDQVWLHAVTGIPEGRISEYVNNHRNMSLNTAKTIAAALGIEIENLYEWIRVDV